MEVTNPAAPNVAVEEAIVENEIARIEASTEVVKAEAEARVAEAEAQTAIAEAKADVAEEIVNEELTEETEVDESWLNQKFSELSAELKTLQEANLLSVTELKTELSNLKTEFLVLLNLLVSKLIPAEPIMSTPPLSPETNLPIVSPEKEGVGQKEVKTEKKHRKI